MAEVSRTARVIQNAKVALFFYCINLVLQFFSRKIFLDCLGAELLGLNTTAQSLLQILNLAESGLGTAIAFALYKPLSTGNRQEINDIVSIQGWFYRWVALFVLFSSIALMVFFPKIFSDIHFPLFYAYGTFISLLISSLLGYFSNYKMIVLSADQKEYKITVCVQGINIVKLLTQTLAIFFLNNGYLYWILLEVVFAIILSILISYIVNREYPWLKPDVSRGSLLKVDYSFILLKTKQLLFHRIAAYVLGQMTPLLIFYFIDLVAVAIYGNYRIIMGGCNYLVDALSKGFYSSVGNLIAENNIKKVKEVFWQLVSLRLYIASVICVGIFFFSKSFVVLWLGEDYLLGDIAMSVMTLTYFIQMTRTCDYFLYAYGLFSDVWAPVAESLLNFVFSVVLGCLYGLTGILFGVLISQLIIVNSWKAYFLYKKGFRENINEYVFKYTIKLLQLSSAFGFVYIIDNNYFSFNILNLLDWVTSAFIVVGIYSVTAAIICFMLDNDFKKIVSRVIRVTFKLKF
mgnify:CR=1 FL=1